MYETLIDVQTLANESDGHWVIVDCRFDLTKPDAGRMVYMQAPYAFT